ncbi:MAG TPA: AEC family transporter [Anaerovoracaceae bacterium]|nr:AEC family transporter [Anaerovoracaceae bacterium]
MVNGIISVIVIFFIFSVGFWFSLRKTWPANTPSVLSFLVVKVAAPALAIISISDRFTRELIRASAVNLLILLVYTALLFLTGKALSKAIGLKSGKKTVFEVTFTFSNTIFIGLPINEIVFGSEGLPYLFTFYLITLAGFWSLGAYELAKASPLHSKEFSLKKIFSPGLTGVLIGGALVQMDLSIPMALDTALRYLGSLTVPLSLLVIGANLVVFTNGLPKIAIDELAILAGKFIISPLYMLALLRFFHVDGLAFQVFILTAAMPCHMQTSILAEYYGVEGPYASKLVSLSTLACLITIPIYVTLLK